MNLRLGQIRIKSKCCGEILKVEFCILKFHFMQDSFLDSQVIASRNNSRLF